MTFRERLADLISNGALTQAREVRDFAVQKRLETADKYAWAVNRMVDMSAALERIAAMETPNANATVRRMAKVAREVLK